MIRKKQSGADNQQERFRPEYFRGYVAGLVDGEGSFHIAFQKRKDLPKGLSVIPEFHVSQNFESQEVLKLLQKILGCGYIKPNHRNSPIDRTFVFVVRNRYDLLTKIIPFFHHTPLLTQKKKDFELFSEIVEMMDYGLHKTKSGFARIIDLAYKMNASGKRRSRSKNELLKYLD